MDEDARRRLAARISEESQLPYCDDDEVEVSLEWEMDGYGALGGRIVLRNTGHRVCRVGGKPVATPLDAHGHPLPVQSVQTMELRMPTWVVLRPGARAAAGVSWNGWCGDAASGRVRVRWEHGDATVAVSGPAQPRCHGEGHAENLSSTWFRVID